MNTPKYDEDNLTIIKPEHQIKITAIQEEIIAFCKDQSFLQAYKSFYNLGLSNQLDYNNCVSTVTSKTKQDIWNIENFYTKCCHVSDKKLLTNRCQVMFSNLINSYHNYLVINKGLYIEYTNFDQSIKLNSTGH